MAITSKTRKELWAKSGNRCAICKKELVHQISQEDGSFIIGDECHIISSSIDVHIPGHTRSLSGSILRHKISLKSAILYPFIP